MPDRGPGVPPLIPSPVGACLRQLRDFQGLCSIKGQGNAVGRARPLLRTFIPPPRQFARLRKPGAKLISHHSPTSSAGSQAKRWILDGREPRAMQRAASPPVSALKHRGEPPWETAASLGALALPASRLWPRPSVPRPGPRASSPSPPGTRCVLMGAPSRLPSKWAPRGPPSCWGWPLLSRKYFSCPISGTWKPRGGTKEGYLRALEQQEGLKACFQSACPAV